MRGDQIQADVERIVRNAIASAMHTSEALNREIENRVNARIASQTRQRTGGDMNSRFSENGMMVDPPWEYTAEWKARLAAITISNREFEDAKERLFPPQSWFDEDLDQRTGAKE